MAREKPNKATVSKKKPTQELDHESPNLQTTGKSKAGGRFKKGRSGNPDGRKPGTVNKVTRAFREAVTAAFDEMEGTEGLVAWARENRTEFYKLAIRLVPPGSPVKIGPLKGSLADYAKTVFARISDGTISPEQGSTIMQALSAQARIVEVDEIEKRVAALEKEHKKGAGAHG